MTKIAHTVHIEASPQKVWEVLVDVDRWPRFAPQFRSVERKDAGPLKLGSSAQVTPHGFMGAIWEVTEYEEGRSFVWEADLLPGARLVADHVIEPADVGTRLRLSLTSSGPVAMLLSPVLGRISRRNTR